MRYKGLVFLMFFLAIFLFGFFSTAGTFNIGGTKISTCDNSEPNCGIEHIESAPVFIGSSEESGDIFKVNKSGSYMEIDFTLYESLGNGSYFRINSSGEIEQAEIIPSSSGAYWFKNNEYSLSEGQKLLFKNGSIYISSTKGTGEGPLKFGFTPSVGDKINLNGPVKFGKDDEGRTTLEGDFEFNGNAVSGLDGGSGKISISEYGKISKIWRDTHADYKGIKYRAEKPVNVYYETIENDVDIGKAKKKGNYFIYEEHNRKIFAGGKDFKFKLMEGNTVYPALENEREVEGFDENLESELSFEPVNSNMRLSRKDSEFVLDHGGEVIIKNGEAEFTSRDGSIFAEPSGANNGFSFNMSVNGQYEIEDSNLLVDGRKIGDINSGPYKEVLDRASKINEGKKDSIKQELESKWNARPREYFGYIDEKEEKKIVEWVYEASDSANDNKEGVKVTPSEIYTTAMLEGLSAKDGFMSESDISTSKGYYEDPYTSVYSYNVLGLDNLGNKEVQDELRSEDFIPEDIEMKPIEGTKTNEQGEEVSPVVFDNLGEGIKALAGEFALRKSRFKRDYVEKYGEGSYQKLTEDEKFFWTSVYYNTGSSNGRDLLNEHGKDYYSAQESQRSDSYLQDVKNNALIRTTTKKMNDKLGLFSFY